jgi:membrane protease YdiL (CAAX protease family)
VCQVAALAAVRLVLRAAGAQAGAGGVLVLLAFAFTAPLLVLVTLFFLRTLDRRGLPSLGVRFPAGGRTAALRQAVRVPLAVVGLLAAWLACLALLPGVAVRFGGRSSEIAGPSGVLWLAALLAGFLLQGGVEEWVFRGYIYHALRERWRRGTAVLVSSLLFAALHGANPDFSAAALLNTFLAGMIFASLVEQSGSLWSAVLAHGVWNFAVSSLLSLPVSGVSLPHLLVLSVQGPDLLTGGGFGPEGSLLLSLLALPIALWIGRRPGAGPRRPLQEIEVSTGEDDRPPPPPGTGGGPSLA